MTEDRTVLDFSMPRYLGSGFGFGSFNPAAEQDGRKPGQVYNERMQFYFAQRRSVVPYLDNLGGEDPRAVEARIAAYARAEPFPSGARSIPADAWRRP